MARKTYKGRFSPKNPQKYKGDPTNIIYRSSWELAVFIKLDSHPDVLLWSSEEVIVPYTNPFDQKLHRYFPDVIVKKKEKDGTVKVYMIEVKPHRECVPPKTPTKKTRKYLTEVYTYSVNQAKWDAAKKYCERRGWVFQVLTEKELGL